MDKKNEVTSLRHLTSQSRNLQTAGAKLVELFGGFSSKELPEKVRAIRLLAEEAIAQERTLRQALSKDFLPPLDREDLLLLSQQLALITQRLADAAQKPYLLRLPHSNRESAALAKALAECLNLLRQLIMELNHFRKSRDFPRLFQQAQAACLEGRRLYAQSCYTLYGSANHTREWLAWQQTLDALYAAILACQETVFTYERIVLKNT